MTVKALTPRECEVLDLLAAGMNSTQGSEILGITRSTFRNHVLAIHNKLGVRTNAGAVATGFHRGYLT